MPERPLLSIVARTAYWLGWHHHFGPASGSDPKISDPLGRYCMAVFTGGANIGPYEAARHIAGVSARELSMIRNRHIDLNKLNAAIATVVNAFAELDVVKAWGDGTAVAADGTQGGQYDRCTVLIPFATFPAHPRYCRLTPAVREMNAGFFLPGLVDRADHQAAAPTAPAGGLVQPGRREPAHHAHRAEGVPGRVVQQPLGSYPASGPCSRPAGRCSTRSTGAARWPAPPRTCPPAATARSGRNTAAAAPSSSARSRNASRRLS
jgi:Tn3 transposase DDE domain